MQHQITVEYTDAMKGISLKAGETIEVGKVCGGEDHDYCLCHKVDKPTEAIRLKVSTMAYISRPVMLNDFSVSVEPNQPQAPDSIITRTELRKLLDISRTTEYRMYEDEELPPRVIVNGNTIGYRASDIKQWIDEHLDVRL